MPYSGRGKKPGVGGLKVYVRPVVPAENDVSQRAGASSEFFFKVIRPPFINFVTAAPYAGTKNGGDGGCS